MTILSGKTDIELNIILDDNTIQNINSKSPEKYFKFLGFRIDDKLSWKHHIKHVTNKLKAVNYLIASIKNSHPIHIKKLIYQSLGQSHLEYGLPIWHNKNCIEIMKLQKKIIRNICNTKYNSHTDPIFGKLKLLKINDLFKSTTIRAIKKAHLGQTPKIIQEIFKIHTPERPLRISNNIKPILNSGRIHNELPNIWNSLDENMKGSINLKNLMNKFKSNCISKYNEFRCDKTDCYSCKT